VSNPIPRTHLAAIQAVGMMFRMAEKIIRDPVHDVIAFRLERPVDALLFRLLNAAEFQRLRRIVQLGMASLAYPGADHSRYSHSLGVMETARKMLAQLRLSHPIDAQSETICLVAALLHDLGHGPLSHVFEHVSGIEHEKLTQRLIADPSSDVHRILAEHDRQLPTMLLAFYRCEPGRTFLHDILSSQLDADRFDYLLRDNLMTGSRYGDFDLRWLLHALTIDPATSRLAVTWKGVSAAESYLQSRYHMYRNVYFHKVVRSAEGMVKLALQRAKRLAVQDRLEWPPRDHTVYKALLGQRLTIEEFTELDDISVMHCFKLWMHAEDAVLAGLCRGLLYRKVFKTIDLSHLDDESARTVIAAARKAVEGASGDPHYDLFVDEPSDTPYETYEPLTCDGAPGIVVLNPAGQLVNLSTLSPLPQALSQRLMFRRLHILPAWKHLIEL
jgi:HD superfamily phosphohydrolase